MAARYSYPSQQQQQRAGSSLAAPTTAATNTYPLSPGPQSALPSSPTYRARSGAAGSSSSSNSFLSRTPTTTTIATSSSTPDILDLPRDKNKTAQVASSAFAFLYAEIVSYTQSRVSGIGELERRLSLLGYHHGQRFLPLLHSRLENPSAGGSSGSKNPKRETRLLPTLLWVHSQAWKALFGKQADSLERSTERSDEYMISTNTPIYSRGISIPKDMAQLSVEAYTAGIVEAILDGLGFPARVTAHSVPTPEHPQRTTILIKLDKSVMQREEALGT